MHQLTSNHSVARDSSSVMEDFISVYSHNKIKGIPLMFH